MKMRTPKLITRRTAEEIEISARTFGGVFDLINKNLDIFKLSELSVKEIEGKKHIISADYALFEKKPGIISHAVPESKKYGKVDFICAHIAKKASEIYTESQKAKAKEEAKIYNLNTGEVIAKHVPWQDPSKSFHDSDLPLIVKEIEPSQAALA